MKTHFIFLATKPPESCSESRSDEAMGPPGGSTRKLTTLKKTTSRSGSIKKTTQALDYYDSSSGSTEITTIAPGTKTTLKPGATTSAVTKATTKSGVTKTTKKTGTKAGTTKPDDYYDISSENLSDSVERRTTKKTTVKPGATTGEPKKIHSFEICGSLFSFLIDKYIYSVNMCAIPGCKPILQSIIAYSFCLAYRCKIISNT